MFFLSPDYNFCCKPIQWPTSTNQISSEHQSSWVFILNFKLHFILTFPKRLMSIKLIVIWCCFADIFWILSIKTLTATNTWTQLKKDKNKSILWLSKWYLPTLRKLKILSITNAALRMSLFSTLYWVAFNCSKFSKTKLTRL